MFQTSKLLRVVLIIGSIIAVALAFIAWSWYFTTSRLNASARSFGIFPSPIEAMMTEIRYGWVGIQEAWIRSAEPETALGGGPHVWFVTACVWAESRADGSTVGSATHDFDFPGGYYVETKDGWVPMSEGSALFVGFWMKVFGLAGDGGDGEVIHGAPSKPVCVPKSTETLVPISEVITTALTKPLRVLFDDDGSRDGTTALFFLLSDPEVSVEAISISYGEAHPAVYIQHIGRKLDEMKINTIPLGAGQDAPLAGSQAFPEWMRQDSNNFWGMPQPNPEKSYPVQDAAKLMVTTINHSPQPVTIFISGASTNLAQALQLDPDIRNNIEAVYMMGGAVYVSGNIQGLLPGSSNTVAEWNIYTDPQAAKAVFESGLNIYLVPLDATNQVLVGKEDTVQWRAGGKTAQFAADIYDRIFKDWGTENAPIWDLMTAEIMTNPDSCRFQALHLDVVTADGKTAGQTALSSDREPNANVCLEPDEALIKQTLIEVFSSSK